MDGAVFARDQASKPPRELSSDYMLAVGGRQGNPYHRPRDATHRPNGPSGGTIHPHFANAATTQIATMQQSYAAAVATQPLSRTGGLTKYD